MTNKVTKAVFPVAGFGTRFLPATKSVPKEILPLVDRPLIQYAIDEARAAGIKEFIFVTSRGKSALEDYFDSAPELEPALREGGKTALLELLKQTDMDSGAVAYVRQQERRGLGHAVWCARRLIGDEPFAVILPDDVIDAETPCLQQMIEAYADTGGNMVATMEVPPRERLLLRHPRRRRRGRPDDAGPRHGGEAEARGRAVEPGGDRPLHPDAAGPAQPRGRRGRRRRRDPADRRDRRARSPPAATCTPSASRAGASTAARSPATCRRPSPSASPGRTCARSSSSSCARVTEQRDPPPRGSPRGLIRGDAGRRIARRRNG